jgi:hypothetical protein
LRGIPICSPINAARLTFWAFCKGLEKFLITMNTIRTHAHWPIRIGLLLWLLVLVPVFLSGCKSQLANSTRVKTATTNMVVVTPPGSVFISSSNPLAITITNPISIVVTGTALNEAQLNQGAQLEDIKKAIESPPKKTEPDKTPSLDTSEIWKNRAEIAAVFIAGIWTVWLFFYERRAHAPSLDGDLTIESSTLSKDLDVVSVRALWNNRGKFPIKLNKEDCFVLVFKVDAQLPKGPLVFEDDKALEKLTLFSGDTVLEQGAQSVFRAHFILEKGPVYLFRWRLKSAGFWDWSFLQEYVGNWKKEIIWHSSQ